MRVSVLTENTSVSSRFNAEHGLSLFIESCGKNILFDMGQSELFAENAEKLGIDISKVDFAVLSHGHYDHGGGIEKFLELNHTAPVYLSRYAFGDYYSSKYIGLDKKLRDNPRLCFVSDYCKIQNDIELFSCNDRQELYPTECYGLTAEIDGVRSDDDFRHEQYLLLNENGKRILISGCSHKGVLNIVNWFEPDILIGGFHFMKLDPNSEDRIKLDEAAERLIEKNTIYYTCHCTGAEQFSYLSRKTERINYISCGMQFEI